MIYSIEIYELSVRYHHRTEQLTIQFRRRVSHDKNYVSLHPSAAGKGQRAREDDGNDGRCTLQSTTAVIVTVVIYIYIYIQRRTGPTHSVPPMAWCNPSSVRTSDIQSIFM